jgi:Tfp pilus assembly protein PilN
MIEINLIPDVKQELIRARRVRSTVISGAIVVGIAAVALVILLAVYVFGAQALRNKFADDAIMSENSKLTQVKDLPNMLTVQNQLTKLSGMHDSKMISSRSFDVLSAIVPPEPNSIAVSRLALNSEENTITIEGQAVNGYPALETFKKTIEATKVVYATEGEDDTSSVKLASDVVEGERSYGDDETGRKVLRFTLSFTYADELFARDSKNTLIVGPGRTNATDSFIGIPQSLFTNKATDPKETN